MTRRAAYQAAFDERFNTPAPAPPADSDAVKAERRRILVGLPAAAGRHPARFAQAYGRRDGAK